jgi:peptidoglycan/LPS O-acetylase OafA/YrhL
VLWRGSAAVLLVSAAACGRERAEVPALPIRALAAVGDASYALYLVHPFVIRGLREVALRVGLASPVLYIVLALAGAVVAAVLLYHWFERPATRLLRRWLGS